MERLCRSSSSLVNLSLQNEKYDFSGIYTQVITPPLKPSTTTHYPTFFSWTSNENEKHPFHSTDEKNDYIPFKEMDFLKYFLTIPTEDSFTQMNDDELLEYYLKYYIENFGKPNELDLNQIRFLTKVFGETLKKFPPSRNKPLCVIADNSNIKIFILHKKNEFLSKMRELVNDAKEPHEESNLNVGKYHEIFFHKVIKEDQVNSRMVKYRENMKTKKMDMELDGIVIRNLQLEKDNDFIKDLYDQKLKEGEISLEESSLGSEDSFDVSDISSSYGSTISGDNSLFGNEPFSEVPDNVDRDEEETTENSNDSTDPFPEKYDKSNNFLMQTL